MLYHYNEKIAGVSPNKYLSFYLQNVTAMDFQPGVISMKSFTNVQGMVGIVWIVMLTEMGQIVKDVERITTSVKITTVLLAIATQQVLVAYNVTQKASVSVNQE